MVADARWLHPKTSWTVGIDERDKVIDLNLLVVHGPRAGFDRAIGKLSPEQARLLASRLNTMAAALEEPK